MFPKHYFQQIVLFKNKHCKPYILNMHRIKKVKHSDLIFKILHNLVPIFGLILPSTNHMQQDSFTQLKHSVHTLISPFLHT